ncbi:MAG: RagB/SusD family nutrient uptake outer membrane protein [Bacteroidales bacterium]|nr:RagB/SusD family nutrient uptake outer membrane protein [Bacteroidales bacterium]
MKKLINIILSFSLSLILISCEDFLDVELNNQITQAEVFAKRNTTEQYLAQVYGYLPDYYDWVYGTYGSYVPMSDEGLFSWMGGLAYNTFMKGSWTPNTTSIGIWENMYKAINQATIFMDNVDKNQELSISEKTVMKAEARFLRAFYYTILIERYGPVYVWGDNKPDITIKAETIDRMPLDENINFIVAEYDKAAEILPKEIEDIQRYGRITKGTVLAAKSRFLLYMASPLFNGYPLYKDIKDLNGDNLFPITNDPQKWQKAADAAKAVIDMNLYELCQNTSEKDPFKRAIKSYQMVTLEKWNKETIWGQWHKDGMSVLVRCNPPRFCKTGYGGYCPSVRLVDGYPMSKSGRFPILGYNDDLTPIIDSKSGYDETGFTENYKHPLDTFLLTKVNNSCVGRDARFYASILANGFPWYNPSMKKGIVTFFNGGTSTYIGSGDCVKSGYMWRRSTDPSLNTNQGNWGSLVFPVFRLAEIYLNYAEACNEKPTRDENEALKYLNLIRQRVGLNKIEEAYPEVIGNKDLLRTLIQKERMVEMAFEDVRFNDIRRWLIAEDVINEKVVTRNLSAKNFEDSWQRTTSLWAGGGREFLKKNLLFPIPQAQLNEMQNMTQNYGW